MKKSVSPYALEKCLPRMSWSPANLYNLYRRSLGPESRETNFSQTRQSLYKQRWNAKTLVRGYHGDYIKETTFKKSFVPEALPRVPGDKDAHSTPLTSMFLVELEKRLDTVVFRACFAYSIYYARSLVTSGKVRVNGKVTRAPSLKLSPGDLVQVEPAFVSTVASKVTGLRPSKEESAAIEDAAEELEAAAEESAKESAAEEIAPEESVSEESAIQDPNIPEKEIVYPFALPPFAGPFLFVPPYIVPDYATCSAIYLRHPQAKPGKSEIPSPYDADGEVMKLAWEYYASLGRRKGGRPSHLRGIRLGA